MAFLRSSYQSINDEVLLQRYIQREDTVAYSVLYNRYFKSVCKYLCWRGLDKATAEDISQNIFLKIHESPTLFDPSQNFKTWLFVIVRNQWKNALRDQQTRREYHKHAPWLPIEKTQGETASTKKIAVQRAIAKLSDAHREVIALKYSSNFTIQEISSILGCSPGTVKSRLFYAIQSIKEKV